MQSGPKYFTRHEVNLIFKATKNPRDHLLVNLLWQTGARISELLDTRLEDIDFYIKTIRLRTLKRSGNPLRAVPLNPGIMKEIASHVKKKRLSSKDRLFSIVSETVNKMLIRVVLKAGLDRDRAHPHTFCHSFAVNCLLQDNPLPLTALKNVLGHSNLSSTVIYSGITETDMRRCFDGFKF